MHTIAFTVVHGDPMSIRFGNAIRTPRVQWSRFELWHFLDLTENFAGTSLVKANFGVDVPDGVQQAGHAEGGHVAGENRLSPRCLDKALRGQVVYLIGLA